jgi:hypothetical protein
MEFQGLQDWKTAGFMVQTRNSPGTGSRTMKPIVCALLAFVFTVFRSRFSPQL